ncbi:MAG: NAD(P)H-quinone oxidoreductase [Candidatus Sumerlaeia bacterium]
MKTILVTEYGGPEVMRLVEAPDPQPAAGQVVVRMRAVGVNPVDTYLRSGQQGYTPPLPWTPGFDGAGEVEAVGEGVSKVRPGDRVYLSGALAGTYTEKALCREDQVWPLPPQTSFEQGAALYVNYATAYCGLFQVGGGVAGETVLVHGASGGVGVAAVQWARAAGMTVIGTGGTERGRELVLREGAHHVLDHTAPDYMDRLNELTGGNGPDLILEMLANVNLERDLAAVARFGRIVVIGSRGTIEINPRWTMRKNAQIRGLVLFNVTALELRAIHAAIRAGLEAGTLRPVVGRVFPLAAAPAAHEAIMAPGAYGKIVLIP